MSSTTFTRGVPAASAAHAFRAVSISAAPLVLVGTPAAVRAWRNRVPLSAGGWGAGGWGAGGTGAVGAGPVVPGAAADDGGGVAALDGAEPEEGAALEEDAALLDAALPDVGVAVGEESPHPAATTRTTAA